MLLKDLKETVSGLVRTFTNIDGKGTNKKVLYTTVDDLMPYITHAEYMNLKDWWNICIIPSGKDEYNEVFYFNWGYGGNPNYRKKVFIHKEASRYGW